MIAASPRWAYPVQVKLGSSYEAGNHRDHGLRSFPARASETGKLYGSVTTQMIADAIKAKSGVEVARRQIDSQPLRMLGEYKVHVRLTVDLIPTIDVIVYREGEAFTPPVTPKTVPLETAEAVVEAEPTAEPETE